MYLGSFDSKIQLLNSPNFKNAFYYINSRNIMDFTPGKYDIDGVKSFAIVQEYDTEEEEKKHFEVHGNYADLQFILEGEEAVCFSRGDQAELVTNNLSSLDYALYNTQEFEKMVLKKGEYVVFVPGELHKVGVMNQKKTRVKKLTIKVLCK